MTKNQTEDNANSNGHIPAPLTTLHQAQYEQMDEELLEKAEGVLRKCELSIEADARRHCCYSTELRCMAVTISLSVKTNNTIASLIKIICIRHQQNCSSGGFKMIVLQGSSIMSSITAILI